MANALITVIMENKAWVLAFQDKGYKSSCCLFLAGIPLSALYWFLHRAQSFIFFKLFKNIAGCVSLSALWISDFNHSNCLNNLYSDFHKRWLSGGLQGKIGSWRKFESCFESLPSNHSLDSNDSNCHEELTSTRPSVKVSVSQIYLKWKECVLGTFSIAILS